MAQHIKSDWHGARDLYTFCDSPADLLAEYDRLCGRQTFGGAWYAGETSESARRKVQLGDNLLVQESDKLLAQLEDQVVHSRHWRNLDDVVGALPNVPAYIAGTPINMRRRVKVSRDDAPLTLFVDLTSSGGINAHALLARGVATLALTRLLVEHRAVTLYAGIALGGGQLSGGSSTIAWRIDTAPLDLARAVFMLASASVSRGIGYQISQAREGHASGGSWPFHNFEKHKASGQERLERVLGETICYVPPIFVTDELVTAPVEWIKRELAKYAGAGADADD